MTEVISMDAEPTGVVFSSPVNSLNAYTNGVRVNTVNPNSGLKELGDQLSTLRPMQKNVLNDVGAATGQGQHGPFSFNAKKSPLAYTTNQVAIQPLNSSKKKWVKLLREVGETNTCNDMEIQDSRCPELELSDLSVKKKKRVSAVGTMEMLQWLLVSSTTSHNELPYLELP